MARDSTPDVAVYVVWSSQLGAHEQNVDAGTTLIPGSRVHDFWDPDLVVGTAFSRVAALNKPAWDFYMLFGPNASWPASGVPTPAWWEHQLGGLPPERHLDATRFADSARALERGIR